MGMVMIFVINLWHVLKIPRKGSFVVPCIVLHCLISTKPFVAWLQASCSASTSRVVLMFKPAMCKFTHKK